MACATVGTNGGENRDNIGLKLLTCMAISGDSRVVQTSDDLLGIDEN